MNSLKSIVWNDDAKYFDVVLADGTAAVINNLIVLDFDGGENLSYHNSQMDVNVENIVMSATVSEEDQVQILARLNNSAANDTLFLSKDDAEKYGLSSDSFSTIYVGSTDAFEFLGENVYGISETTGDYAADVKNDNAFIMTNKIGNASTIVNAIAHEAGHLTGTVTHDYTNNGLTIDDYYATSFTGSTATLTHVSNCAYYYFNPQYKEIRVFGLMGSWTEYEPSVSQNAPTSYNVADGCTMYVDDSVTINGTKLIFNYLDGQTGTVDFEKKMTGSFTFNFYTDCVFNLRDYYISSGSTLKIENVHQGRVVTMKNGKIAGSGTLILKSVMVDSSVDLVGFAGTVDAGVTEDMYNNFNTTLRPKITTLELYNSAASGTTTYTTAPDNNVVNLHLWSVNSSHDDPTCDPVAKGTTLIYKGSLANRNINVTLHGGAGLYDTIQLSSNMSGFSGTVTFDPQNSKYNNGRNFRCIIDTDMSVAAEGSRTISGLGGSSQQQEKYLVLTGNATIVQSYTESNYESATNLGLRVGTLINGYFTSARTESETAGSTITIKGDDVLGNKLNTAKVGKYVIVNGTVSLGDNVTLYGGTTALDKTFLTGSGGTSAVAQIYGYDTEETTDDIYGALIYDGSKLVLAWADTAAGVSSAATTISTPEVNKITYGTTVSTVRTDYLSVFRSNILYVYGGTTYEGVLKDYGKVISEVGSTTKADTNIVFTVTGDILDADLSEFEGTITCKDSTVTDIQVFNNNAEVASTYTWTENRILEGYNGSVGGYGKLVLGSTCGRTFNVNGYNGMTVSGGAASGSVNYDVKGISYTDTVYTGYNGTMYLVNGGTVNITDTSYLDNHTNFSKYTGTITVDTDDELTKLYTRTQGDLGTTTISVTGGSQTTRTIDSKVFGNIVYARGGSGTGTEYYYADKLTFTNCTINGNLINNDYIYDGKCFTSVTMTNCTVGGDIECANGISLTNTTVGGDITLGNYVTVNSPITISGSTVGNITTSHHGYAMNSNRDIMNITNNSVVSSISLADNAGGINLTIGNYDSSNSGVNATVSGDITTSNNSAYQNVNCDAVNLLRKATVSGNVSTKLNNDLLSFAVGGYVTGNADMGDGTADVIQVGGGTTTSAYKSQVYGKNNATMTGSTGATVLVGGTVTHNEAFELYNAAAGTCTTATLGTAYQITSSLYGVLFYADAANNAGLSLAWGKTADAATTAMSSFIAGYGTTYSAENSMVDRGEGAEAMNRTAFRSWLDIGGSSYTVYGGTVDTVGGAINTKSQILSEEAGGYSEYECALCITTGDYIKAGTDLSGFNGKFVGGGTISLQTGESIDASRFMINLSGNTYFSGIINCASGSATVNMTGNTAQSFTINNNIMLGGTMTSGTVNVQADYNHSVTGSGGTIAVAAPTDENVISGTIFNNYSGTVSLASQYNVIDLTGFTGTGFTVVGGGTIKLDGGLGDDFNLDNFTGTLLVDTASELTSAVSKSNSNITIIANPSAQLTEDSITLTDGDAKSLTFTSGGASNLTVSGGTYGEFSNRIGTGNLTEITGGTVTGDLNITSGTLSGVVVGGTVGIGVKTGITGGTLALTNGSHVGDVITFKGATASTLDSAATYITVDATSSMGGFDGCGEYASKADYTKLNLTLSGTANGDVTTQRQQWVHSTDGRNKDVITITQTGTIYGDLETGTGSDYITLDVGAWVSGDANFSWNNEKAEGGTHDYIKITNTYGSGGGTTGHMANSTGAAGIAGRIYVPSQTGTSYYQNNDYSAETTSGGTVSLSFSALTATSGSIQKVADNLYIGLFYAGDAEGNYFDEVTASGVSRTSDVYGIGLSIAWGRSVAEVNTAITNYRAAVQSGSISSNEYAIVNGETMDRDEFRNWLENGTQSYTVYGGTVDAVGGSVHAQSTIVSVRSEPYGADNCALLIDGTDYLAATTNIAGFAGKFVGNGTINLAAGTSIDASRFYTALNSGTYFTGTVTAASGSASVNMDGNTALSFSIDNSIALTGTMESGTVKIGGGYARAITATGGTIEVTDGTVAGATVFASSGFGSGAAVKVDNGATLTAASTTIAAAVTNAGTLTATSGTLTGAITNSGTITAAAGSIANIASNAASGTVTANDGTVGTIGSNLGTVNLNYTTVTGTIGNGSVLNVTGGSLGGAVSGDGTLTVKKGSSATTVSANVANAVTVESGAGLSVTAGSITTVTSNSGTISMSSGTLGTVTVNSGSITTSGSGAKSIGAADNSGSISLSGSNNSLTGNLTGAGTLSVTSGASAALTADKLIENTVSNAGTFNMANGGTVTGAVTNSGTLNVTGGTVANTLTNTGTANLNYATATEAITNNSALNVTGSIISEDITGSGTLTVKSGTTSTKIAASDSASILNAVTVESGATLTGNQGSTQIEFKGAVTNNGIIESNEQLILLTFDSTVTNSGTISAPTNSNNVYFNYAVANTGTITLGAFAEFKGNLTGAGTLTINDTDYSNVSMSTDALVENTINNSGNFTMAKGGTITGAVTNNSTGTINVTGGTVKGAVANNGTFNVTGGTIASAVTGTGTLNVKSSTNATTVKSDVANAVIVSSGATLVASEESMDGIDFTGAVTNNGTIITSDFPLVTFSSAVTNSGTISNAAGMITFSSAVDNTGLINASVYTYLYDDVTGAGTLATAAGGTMDVSNNSLIENTVDNSGEFIMSSGGTVTGAVTNSSGGVMNMSGAIVSGALTNSSGGIVNMSGAIVSGALTNSSGGIVNMTAGTATSTLTNSGGIMNMSGGTIENDVSGAGTLNVKSSTDATIFKANENLLVHNTVNVESGATLTAAGVNWFGDVVEIKGVVTNSGTITTAADNVSLHFQSTLDNSSTIEVGYVDFYKQVANTGAINVSGSAGIADNVTGAGTLSVTSGASASLTADKLIANTVDNSGEFNMLNGGTVTGAVTNAGTVNMSGAIVSGALTNSSGGIVNMTAGTATSTLTNSSGGIMNISGGTYTNTLTNSAGGIMNISGGTFATASGKVVKNLGTMVLNGDNYIRNASNTDDATVSGGTTFIEASLYGAGAMTVASDAELVIQKKSSYKGIVSNTVTNNGTFTMVNGGTVAGIVTNAGTVNMSGVIVGSAVTNISGGIINVNGGTFVKKLVNDSNGTVNLAGGTTYAVTNVSGGGALNVSSGAMLVMLNTNGTNGKIEGTVTNGGTVIMNGGSINKIANSGTLNISGTSTTVVTTYTGDGTLQFDRDNIKSGSVTTYEDMMTGATIAKGKTVKVNTDDSTVKDTTMGGSFTDKDGDTLWIGSYEGTTGVTADLELNSDTASESYRQFSDVSNIDSVYNNYNGVIKVTGGSFGSNQYAGSASFSITGAASGNFYGGKENAATTNNVVTVSAASMTAKGVYGAGKFTAAGTYALDASSVTVANTATGSISMVAGGSNITSVATAAITVSGAGTTTINGSVTCQYATAGSLAGGSANVTVTGDQTLNISAGTYTKTVAAGGILQNNKATLNVTGNLTTNITGGTFKYVFGGAFSTKGSSGIKTTVNGNVNMTFNSSVNDITVENIYAGSNGAGNWGKDYTATVTFTGYGSKLTFSGSSNGVRGDNAAEGTYISGSSKLVFDNFQGTFGAQYIEAFDTLEVKGGSDMKITCNRTDTIDDDIKTWIFDDGVKLDWTTSHNDFTGDTLSFGDSESTRKDSWDVLVSDSNAIFKGLSDATAVTLYGVAAEKNSSGNWAITGYELSVDTTNHKLVLAAKA